MLYSFLSWTSRFYVLAEGEKRRLRSEKVQHNFLLFRNCCISRKCEPSYQLAELQIDLFVAVQYAWWLTWNQSINQPMQNIINLLQQICLINQSMLTTIYLIAFCMMANLASINQSTHAKYHEFTTTNLFNQSINASFTIQWFGISPRVFINLFEALKVNDGVRPPTNHLRIFPSASIDGFIFEIRIHSLLLRWWTITVVSHTCVKMCENTESRCENHFPVGRTKKSTWWTLWWPITVVLTYLCENVWEHRITVWKSLSGWKNEKIN